MASRQRRGPGTGSYATAIVDLVAVVCVALVTVVLWSTAGDDTNALRVVFGALFVFLLPGYALTAALFPRARQRSGGQLNWRSADADESGYPTPLERLALSIGLSIVIVPLLALFLNFTPWGISRLTVLSALLVLLVTGVTAATARRAMLPPEQRFRVPYRRLASGLVGSGERRRLNAIVAVLVLVAGGTAGGAIAMQTEGQRFTEFYLLSEGGETGESVAGRYPTALEPGEPRTVRVGIENQEGRRTNYTVVAELQTVETVDGERVVVERTELDRFDATVDPGETAVRPRRLTAEPIRPGEKHRVAFHLYRGPAPEAPNEEGAYRRTHLWVTVSADGGGA